ncbi:MAG: transcription termination factor NusA [Bacilli bacterium]
MNNKEFKKAMDALVLEKKLDINVVVDAMKQAFSISYKKNYNESANIKTDIDINTGDIRVYRETEVVDTIDEEEENKEYFITLEDAQSIKKSYKVGDIIVQEVTPEDFGRVAVGVAKQVVLQKIREAERENIMAEFADKEGELMIGFVAMEDARNYYIDLGKSRGILPKTETIIGEKLEMGSSTKVYISKIETTPKGPFILLSRKHYGFVKRLFELEVPEFSDGTLVMHGVAREAGVRSKVCVSSTNENVDAIGSCIGEKGRRIASIIKELGGEKMDLVLYDEDDEKFIANALSPAKNLNVSVTDKENREAVVIADDENLSLAIGKKGINIKLASKLTRYRINIKTIDDINKEVGSGKMSHED